MKAWIPALALLCLCSCSRSVEPGLYEVEDGFLRVGLDSLGKTAALLYRNVGGVEADTVSVSLARDGKRWQMSTRDSIVKPVVLKPYEVPAYHPFPELDLYVNPVWKVGETQDVVYGRIIHRDDEESEPEDLTMDLYYPQDDGADNRPLLMAFHGGAFRRGDKRDSSLVEWCRHFASLGYVVSSVNYRQGYRGDVRSTDDIQYRALKDAHAAVRFLLKRDSLMIHEGRIFACGADAGAITALNLAYMREENLPELLPEGTQPSDSVAPSRPSLLRGGEIRAVANFWGAVTDTAILTNAKIPVISFQSREDPVVPFGEGYPFDDEEMEEDEKDFFQSVWESFFSLFLPEPEKHPFRKMYGAEVIHRVLKSRSVRQELHVYDGERHDLILDDDGLTDYPVFDEMKELTARFFAPLMLTSPVNLRQDPEDPQVFLIDNSEVDTCLWLIEGGAILSKSADAVRVLMFPDEKSHSVTVSGMYTSGLTFNETVSL
ncbi:MAG: alpha/beta hydrolase [Bacteroidales bacterium]|nr:alpha/beta hydrolase [Bacteroidales bacterium]